MNLSPYNKCIKIFHKNIENVSFDFSTNIHLHHYDFYLTLSAQVNIIYTTHVWKYQENSKLVCKTRLPVFFPELK